jgi:membrane dipeptidase
VFIVDAHEDIASNFLFHNRDVRHSVHRTRELEAAGMPCCCDPRAFIPETAMVGLPDHRRGGVGLIFATIFVMPGPPDEMTAKAEAELRYYHELDAGGSIRLIADRAELARLCADWNAAAAPAERPVGFALLMEGADPIRQPSDLETWYRQGLRIVGTSWTKTRYAGGTHAPGPLTDLGRALLAEMERLGVILDVSHMAEESFWEALDRFSGMLVSSHANCREYVPTDRQLSDDMIRAIAGRDGVIGTVLANRFLVPGWTAEQGEPVTLEAVVRHIDRVCQLTGSARHSAIGSDFDGGFGVESTPDELDSVADLAKIGSALEHAGYRQDDIEAILGGNWLRLLEGALPAQAPVAASA